MLWQNGRLAKFSFAMRGRGDVKGSKSNVPMKYTIIKLWSKLDVIMT